MRILPRTVAVACFTLAVLNLPGEITTAATARSMWFQGVIYEKCQTRFLSSSLTFLNVSHRLALTPSTTRSNSLSRFYSKSRSASQNMGDRYVEVGNCYDKLTRVIRAKKRFSQAGRVEVQRLVSQRTNSIKTARQVSPDAPSRHLRTMVRRDAP